MISISTILRLSRSFTLRINNRILKDCTLECETDLYLIINSSLGLLEVEKNSLTNENFGLLSYIDQWGNYRRVTLQKVEEKNIEEDLENEEDIHLVSMKKYVQEYNELDVLIREFQKDYNLEYLEADSQNLNSSSKESSLELIKEYLLLLDRKEKVELELEALEYSQKEKEKEKKKVDKYNKIEKQEILRTLMRLQLIRESLEEFITYRLNNDSRLINVNQALLKKFLPLSLVSLSETHKAFLSDEEKLKKALNS